MSEGDKEKLNKAKEAEKIKAQGNEYYKKKEFESALKYYLEAMDMNPDEIIYYSNIGACYIEMKQYD